MAQPITNLNVGDKVKYVKYAVENETPQYIQWQIAGKNHYKDDLNPGIVDHVTIIPSEIIDIRGFDAKEPNNSDSNRRSYGNNRYRDSNMRQWLNKMGLPWFEPTHNADEPPTDAGTNNYGTGYEDKQGFLSYFTEEELSILVPTNLRVSRNTATDGGGSEVVEDLVFLPSRTEVGLGNENVAEGSQLDIFTDDNSRIAHVSKQVEDYSNYDISGARHYWLRTPFSSGSSTVRIVHTSGALDFSYAYYGNFGVRPLCNLESDILVSDTVDPDGCYTIIYTNVISNDLQKINDTDFVWTVEEIGEQTDIKSQLHIFDSNNNLVATGEVKNGVGTKSETIIPTSAGNYKARVKLWSSVINENWSNEISYTITAIPYVLTLDKSINIQAGKKLDKLKFKAKVNDKELEFKEMDNEKIIYEGRNLDTDKVNLEIEGKDGKIDNVSYTIS